MRISELPEYRNRDELLTIGPDATVLEAARKMTERNYGSIVVTDANGKLVGILTERDMLKRVVAREVDAGSTPVSQVMTTGVKTATVEDEVADCLRQMSNGRFRHLPVLDPEGRPDGMVSQGDFVALTWPDVMRRAGAQTQAMFGSRYQAAVIVGAILLFGLVVSAA